MNNNNPRPAIRILIGAATALGPGKAQLLEAIGRTGSISAAAREMKMSYRRAWLLVDAVNQSFTAELVSTATGGKGGGGARLTEAGREVLERYRAIEAKAAAAVGEDIADFNRLLRPRPRPDDCPGPGTGCSAGDGPDVPTLDELEEDFRRD